MSDKTTKLCPCCGRSMEGYAFKGFSYDEVLAKCGKIHRTENMVIDFTSLTFTKAGRPIKLTRCQWKYLAVLIGFGGAVVNRDTIYRIVVGLDGGTTRSIDTFIALLRHHFGRHIETVHGLGYRWVDDPKPAVKQVKPVKAKKTKKPPQARVVKAKPIKPPKPPKPMKPLLSMVADSRPVESPERIYRIRGIHVQWDGKGVMPELIAGYQDAHGELPSNYALPMGRIRFNIPGDKQVSSGGFDLERAEDICVTWSGSGPLPPEVMIYLDENKSLPPWREAKNKRTA